MSKTLGKSFTSKKASHMNMVTDGIKIRAAKFKNKVKYDRNDKSWMKD